MSALRRVLTAIVIVAATFAAERSGLLSGLNAGFEDLRSAHAGRDASGQFVFVAIDAKSLQSVGEWPWSRQVHADILDALVQAGAADVFFDIDFAFPSDASGDRAFAAALDRAGNAYLAVFQQAESAAGTVLQTNTPLELFAGKSWPALANVFSDRRGVVRFYPYGKLIDGQVLPSAAALLSGAFARTTESFRISFSIRPGTVPTYSAGDVAAGRVPAQAFDGRSVIVGASAIELGDLFAVPVHGILPGALVHVLAAETISTGIVPVEIRQTWILAALFAVLLALQTRALQRPWRTIGGAGAILITSEAGAFAAFLHGSIIVPTAVLYPGLAAYCGGYFIRQLTLDHWIIRRQRTEVENTTKLLRQVFEDSSDAIVVLEASGATRMCSRSAASLFGLGPDGTIDLPGRLRRDARAAIDGQLERSVRSCDATCAGTRRHLEYTVTPSQAFELDGGHDRTTRIATLSVRDVTTLKEQERRIAYLSSFDDLTGALTRNSFLTSVERRMQAGKPFAIFVFDLIRFKTINVVLGRDVGDDVLRHVVKRITRADLGAAAIARLGGDTFACCSAAPVGDDGAAGLARRLAETVSATYDLKDASAQVGVQIGFAIAVPETGVTAAEALSQAEEALDAAHSAGSTAPQPYDPVLSKQQFRSREIERALGRALDRGEFQIWYQPQHRVADGKLIGSEALVRWSNASLGRVAPNEFIAIAESTGFILELGRFVLEQSVEDALAMPPDLGIAVNVSGVQLIAGDVLGDVKRVLETTGLPASRLCLELTESVLLDGSGGLIETMQDVQFLGVSWALDDFGTGYSSMGYLSQLPLEKIKLDKAFTMSLGVDRASLPILSAMSDLCRGLGIKLLCEGVETEDHLAHLQAHGCDEAQGYLFGRPMCLTDFLSYASSQIQESAIARADLR
ncbi:EAL domain-containing protein [Aestuariibius sp. 2305UL40-4]|uniref:EAL domain-containing protein n=1 Tax=Aestuariibius violaceus TaxID=3234132 RepID=UPI00345E1AB3